MEPGDRVLVIAGIWRGLVGAVESVGGDAIVWVRLRRGDHQLTRSFHTLDLVVLT